MVMYMASICGQYGCIALSKKIKYSRTPTKRTPSGPHQCVRLGGVSALRWLDIVITKTLLKNREQNRVTIFTRRSRKLINKMKELPK
jgi:hypothetical protein